MVCTKNCIQLEASKVETLRDFIEKIKNQRRFQNPTIESEKGLLYAPKPANLEEKHRYKLDMTFK